MDALTEQPMLLAGAALALVIVIAVVVNSMQSAPEKSDRGIAISAESTSATTTSKKKKKKKSKAKAAAEEPKVEEPPVAAKEEAPVTASKKKKKKTKAAAQKAPEPEPEPEAAPTKKKKKKKKSAQVAPAPPSKPVEVKPATVVTSTDDDEEDDDEDFDELAILVNNKQRSKNAGAANGIKKKETPKKQDEWTVVNSGGKDATVAAAEADPSAEHTVTLQVEEDEKPVLLGPKGATIQGIQFDSGARLDLNVPVLKITGTESAIAVAMEKVQAILETYKDEKARATAHTKTLEGKEINGSDGVKAIIGKGGATIQSIQSKTECKIDANVELAKVVITGPSEDQVSKAATFCMHAVFGESQHVMDLKSVSMVMVVYGKDYQKIRQMQDESGAKLDIEKGTTTLKISGPSEAVTKARNMVQQWIDFCQGESIQIEANKVGAVYGKGGATVRRIQDRTGAFIEVNDQGKKGRELVPCNILGEPQAVKEAKDMVLKALDGEIELQPGEVQEKMDLDVGAPAVIGRGGSRIRELETTFKVKMVVNGDSGICRIAGKKENVAKAKAEIEKIIAPLLEEKRINAEAERMTQESSTDNPWAGPFTNDADGW